jgi:putative glutamine amidotransferase
VLAERMIEAGRPVFGICRGLQELNVLFGGTLSRDLGEFSHHRDEDGLSFAELFDHSHDVALSQGGVLAAATGARRITVNSVHRQGIDRLGGGLSVEAVATDDGLTEAFSAQPCGGDVLAVQWHPEWDAARWPESRAFFQLIGTALRRSAEEGVLPPDPVVRRRL